MMRKKSVAGSVFVMVGLVLSLGVVSGCGTTSQSGESTMASAISPHVHDGLVLVDSRAGLPAAEAEAWESSRNDGVGQGDRATDLPGATFIERRHRDKIHTFNGRPHNHFRQTIRIREHRIKR